MIRLSLICLLISNLLGQKIFEEFKKGQNKNYHYKETYRFDWIPDNGSYTLSVKNMEGNIIVNGQERSGIEIFIKHKIRAKTEKQAIKLVEENKIDVYHIEDNNLIQINADKKIRYRHNVSTVFNINLPINIQLNLETSGGDINVKHIQGELVLKTSGGDIELKNLSGRIDAKAFGGDIKISSLEGLIRVHTSGGDIDVKHSEGQFNVSTAGGDMEFQNLVGNIEAQTSGGYILLENISGSTISARSAGGDILVKEVIADIDCKTLRGAIILENIKGNADVSTSGGDIEIDELTGSIVCYTSGGNIDGDNIFGLVDASTLAGDIKLEISYLTEMKDYGMNIKTDTGDILIQIPTNLPVNVDAEISGTDLVQDLNSDIPLDIKVNNNRVTGSGSLLAGIIPMKLRASFGTITIEQD